MTPKPMNRAALCCLVATLWMAVTCRVQATDADTFSAVISYQFEDSLSTPDSPTEISSPIVSYQYFEYPSDENLTFTNSANVSYYFGGGVGLTLAGTVQAGGITPLSGVTVEVKRYGVDFWQSPTDANGNYATPTLPAGNYKAIASKPGYLTSINSFAGNAGGSYRLDIALSPLPAAPTTQSVVRSPLATAIRPVIASGSVTLKLFDGTKLVSELSAWDSTRMTVVLTHGWVPRSSGQTGYDTALDWPTMLATMIRSYHPGTSSPPNILVWDWREEAYTDLPQTDIAAEAGNELGKALLSSFGPAYSQHIHFLGHSLGTIVNCYACDYVHGTLSRGSSNPASHWDKQLTQPHSTLFDEAELAALSPVNEQVITASAVLWQLAELEGALVLSGAAALKDWKSPIPNGALWVDNYISAVGLRHDGAVNVSLLTPTLSLDPHALLQDPFGVLASAHGYSYLWYENTVNAAGSASAIGYSSSVEGGLVFPPVGIGRSLGSLWFENIDTPAPLDLSMSKPNLGGLLDAEFTGSCPLAFGLGVLGSAALESGLQFTEQTVDGVVYTTGKVSTAIVQKIGNLWDAARDFTVDALNSTDPEQLLANPSTASTFQVSLFTQAAAPAGLNAANGNLNLAAGAVGTPAYAWCKIQVPEDAGLMAFDFTVSGEPAEDRISCAINEQNVFTLPAKFAPDGTPVSTDLIDVSAYAGKTVEFFFGVWGEPRRIAR